MPGDEPKQKSVLLVDDSETLLRIAADLLAREGFEVNTAANLIEMSRLLSERTFDLVLIDEVMPELFGHDLVGYLKHQVKVPGFIVLWSSMQPARLEAYAHKYQADGSVHKDPTLANLAASVKRFLE